MLAKALTDLGSSVDCVNRKLNYGPNDVVHNQALPVSETLNNQTLNTVPAPVPLEGRLAVFKHGRSHSALISSTMEPDKTTCSWCRSARPLIRGPGNSVIFRAANLIVCFIRTSPLSLSVHFGHNEHFSDDSYDWLPPQHILKLRLHIPVY